MIIIKNIHFCTLENIKKLLSKRIKNKNQGYTIFTYRTGHIPQIKVGEIVNLNLRIPAVNKEDIWVCYGRCLENLPIKYKDISEAGKEEVKKYNCKFHPEDWFFYLSFWKMDKNQVRNIDIKRKDTFLFCEKCNKLCKLHSDYRPFSIGYKLEHIEVHHKQPVYSLTEENILLIFDPTNLICLCESCHNKTKGVKKPKGPSARFITIERWL